MSKGKSTIWFDRDGFDLESLSRQCEGTAVDHLGIHITEIGDDFLRGTMPADHRTFQPYGLIHGGCNVVLTETLGSLAAMLVVDHNKYYCVGQEVNANHLRGVRSGLVTGTARLLYKGRTSQVWEVRVEDERDRLSCISRLTMAVVKRPGE